MPLLILFTSSDPGGHASWTFPAGNLDHTDLWENGGGYALASDAVGANMDLALDNLPSLGGAVITAVEVESRARDEPVNAGGTYRQGVSDNASNAVISAADIDPGAGYAVTTEAVATNEAGLAWDQSRVNATFLRLRKVVGGAGTMIQVDRAYLNVTYNAFGGDYGFTFGLALPLIGAGLRLAEMAGLARMLHRHPAGHLIRFRPHELVDLFHALRNHPRRVYVGA